MDADLKVKIALDSLNKAKTYKSNNNYGRAFAHYLVFLELLPKHRNEHELEFSEALYRWGTTLEARHQIEDLCKCYLQALNYFPLNVEILNNFGAHLIRIDQNEEAKRYLTLANNLDRDFLPAEKNLMTAKLNLVSRWHFRMLNDYERNNTFRKAIESNVVGKNLKILDIGTGSGLLSLFALNSNEGNEIVAVEQSKTMVRIASDIFEENQVTGINLITRNSTELCFSDINGPADILIMEIFDTALFGEHVLDTVIHAKEKLLKDSAKIIPSSGNVYITGIECSDILRKHKFIGSLSCLNLNNVCLTQILSEPYEAENLRNFQFKRVTETEQLVSVDFNNLEQLKSLFYDKLCVDVTTLKCIEPGQIDAFALWFDLNLYENVTITTSPNSNSVKCWEQAIIYVNHPIQVRSGDSFQVQASCLRDRLELNVLNKFEACDQCFKASSEMITFLNDEILVRTLQTFSRTVSSPTKILDLSPFPLLGLILAKDGSICYCSIQNEEDERFVKYVCSINQINTNNIRILEEDGLEQLLRSPNQIDIILTNPVSENGTINEQCLSDLELYYNCLKPDGLLLPQSVNLMIQVVESEYLNYFNKVNNENLFGYKISEHINKYAVSEQWVLDLKFPHRKLSDPTYIGNVLQNDSNPCSTECNVAVTVNGEANGVLYWFEFVYNNEIKVDTLSSTHFNCACFLLSAKILREHTVLKLNIKQHRGLLKIS